MSLHAVARPAAEGIAPGHFTPSPVLAGHVAPVPRRIRAVLNGVVVVDSRRAFYGWEHPHYPQYFIPAQDVRAEFLSDDGKTMPSPFGTMHRRSITVGDQARPGAARFLADANRPELQNTYRIVWGAMDAWYEEDEEVIVHPRSPYTRVDAIRSTRHVRIEKDGVVIAESTSPVAVFETNLPTRWYLNRTDINWQHLRATATQTSCPYKGHTSGYWSFVSPRGTIDDVAWAYDHPTYSLAPMAGLVAFYNNKVDVYVDGVKEVG